MEEMSPEYDVIVMGTGENTEPHLLPYYLCLTVVD